MRWAATVIVLPERPTPINLNLPGAPVANKEETESTAFKLFIPKATVHPKLQKDSVETVWGSMPNKDLATKVDTIYEEMVLFTKNLF